MDRDATTTMLRAITVHLGTDAVVEALGAYGFGARANVATCHTPTSA